MNLVSSKSIIRGIEDREEFLMISFIHHSGIFKVKSNSDMADKLKASNNKNREIEFSYNADLEIMEIFS